jgi:hypothetical protein
VPGATGLSTDRAGTDTRVGADFDIPEYGGAHAYQDAMPDFRMQRGIRVEEALKGRVQRLAQMGRRREKSGDAHADCVGEPPLCGYQFGDDRRQKRLACDRVSCLGENARPERLIDEISADHRGGLHVAPLGMLSRSCPVERQASTKAIARFLISSSDLPRA